MDFIIMGEILVMYFSLKACNKKKFLLNKIFVIIKAEYYEQFNAKQFTLDDFQYDNIEKIIYLKWIEKSKKGYVTVY